MYVYIYIYIYVYTCIIRLALMYYLKADPPPFHLLI